MSKLLVTIQSGTNINFMIQFDYTLTIILLGTTLVGIACGIVGCFIILERKSLVGDALAHAALPGFALAFLYTGNKSSPLLYIGAIISALIGSYCIRFINTHTTLKKETALGIVLSTAFGIGTITLSIIQTRSTAHKAGINKFLLGNAATLLWQDICIIMTITAIIIATTIACWKEFKIFIFNKEFSHTIGMNNNRIELILTMITILAIIIGLQTVGAVLISSLLIAPAITAYQWTKKFSHMILLSCILSCFATILGTLFSSMIPHIPTGPMMVITATTCALISIIIAPILTSKKYNHA